MECEESRRSLLRLRRLLQLEADIGASAESHEGQRLGAELRHGQVLPDAEDEDHAEDDRPDQHLESVETVAISVPRRSWRNVVRRTIASEDSQHQGSPRNGD